MLQKSQTKRLNQIKYLLLIPIIGVFLYAFNTKEIIKPIENKVINLPFVKEGNNVLAKLNKLNTKESIENIRYKLKENGLELEFTNLKYNTNNQIKAIKLSIEDANGNMASAFWEESRNKNGIPNIYIGKRNGSLVISSFIEKKYEDLFQKEKDKIRFINPIQKENVTQVSSGFGMRKHPILKTNKFHNGIDIKAYKDMDVYATAKGKVIKAAYDKLKGNYIQIQHANNYQTNYHHLENIQIEEGAQVRAGEIIGIVGNTGASTGIHLHYEMMRNGKNIDPKMYLNYGEVNKISIQNKTTNTAIDNFNNQFINLDTKIRITDVKRNSDNKITSFTIQTKFKNQEAFKNNFSVKSDKKINQTIRIESINSKSSFKITHNFFGKNISIIIDEKGSVSSIELIKSKPTTTEINTWKKSKKYGIWIDGKRIENNKLNQYLAKDFSSYYVSKLAKNASNYGEYYYQVDLMTNSHYNAYLKKKRNDFSNKNQYKVRKGDTAYSIAQKFNMSVNELYALNSGLNKNLIVGIYLTVENKEAKKIYFSGTKIIITKSTTEAQFKDYISQFKKENIEIKIYDVKRNDKNEIIAIKIEGKSKRTSSTFSYKQSEPISKILIACNKEKDEIYIKNVYSEDRIQTKTKTESSYSHSKTTTKVNIEEEENEEQSEVNIDSFSVIFDKNVTEEKYKKIKKMFKEYGAELSVKEVKRNALGKITTVKIKIQRGDKSAIYIDDVRAHTIVPVEVGVDYKHNNVFIKEHKKKKEKNNTKITISVSETTTDKQIYAYKKIFKDFGVELNFTEVIRDKEGKIKSLKIKSTSNDKKYNSTSFSVSSEKTIVPFKIVYDKNEQKVIFKAGQDKKKNNGTIFKTVSTYFEE